MKSVEDIQIALRELDERHDFSNVRVMPLATSSLDPEQLSQFIESCWKQYYKDQARIIFTPELVSTIVAGEGKDISLVAMVNGELVGCGLGMAHELVQDGRIIKYSLSTGLSTHPAYRGKGLAQLISFEHLKAMAEAGFMFSVHWFDSRLGKQDKKSSLAIHKRNLPFDHHLDTTLFGKAIDPKAAFAIGGVSYPKYLLASVLSKIFPMRGRGEYKGYVFDRMPPYDENVLAFLQKNGHGRPAWKSLEDLDLGQIATYAVSHDGQVMGVVEGLANHTVRGGYFQVDLIAHEKGVPASVMDKFLRHVEYAVSKSYQVSSVVVPRVCTEINLFRIGYFPFMKQVLALNHYQAEDATPAMLLKGPCLR